LSIDHAGLIVEKNAIMQIDFALDAERNSGMGHKKPFFRAV
jgi:hypothetical protein